MNTIIKHRPVGPDFIGDAVWLLAWRQYEEHNFPDNEKTGWHCTLRAQIVVGNKFQTLIAKAEELTPVLYTEGYMPNPDKTWANALEAMVGELSETSTLWDTINYIHELLDQYLNLPALRDYTNKEVARRTAICENGGQFKVESPANVSRFLLT